MAFKGFGQDAQVFYQALGDNNSRPWFEDNRSLYVKEVRDPAEEFITALGGELEREYPSINFNTRRNGAGSLMRINRDIRFSPNKSPYKTNLGLVFWMGEGKKTEVPGFYFHIGTDQIFFYGGQHIFPKDILDRYRVAVATDKTGARLQTILDGLTGKGLPCFEEPAWKKVPRAYPADHPRAGLLRLAGIGVAKVLVPDAIFSASLVEECAEAASRMKPLMDWLLEMNNAGN